MKLFNVLVAKNNSRKIQDIILVKEGFCIKAFIFNGLWFLYHKMWLEFLVLITIDLALSSFADLDKIVLQLGFVFIIGINANYWRVEHLKKNGYKFYGIVFANSMAEAQLKSVKKFKNADFAAINAVKGVKKSKKTTNLGFNIAKLPKNFFKYLQA